MNKQLWEQLKSLQVKKTFTLTPPDKEDYGCNENKRSYDSKRDARRAVRTAGFSARAYKCGVCNAYHITNRDKKENEHDSKTIRSRRMHSRRDNGLQDERRGFRSRG